MRLDTMRVPVSSHRPRRDVTLMPEAGIPADGGRLADPEALRRLPARGTGLDRRNDAACVDQATGLRAWWGSLSKHRWLESETVESRYPPAAPSQCGGKRL